jgi:hypothetical protein
VKEINEQQTAKSIITIVTKANNPSVKIINLKFSLEKFRFKICGRRGFVLLLKISIYSKELFY